MLTRDILMDLITMATQSVLVLTLILAASWMLMEWAEKRRAERECGERERSAWSQGWEYRRCLLTNER